MTPPSLTNEVLMLCTEQSFVLEGDAAQEEVASVRLGGRKEAHQSWGQWQALEQGNYLKKWHLLWWDLHPAPRTPTPEPCVWTRQSQAHGDKDAARARLVVLADLSC